MDSNVKLKFDISNITSDAAMKQQMNQRSLNMEVPIFKMKTTKDSLKAVLSSQPDSYYARGNLVGSFYTINRPVVLRDITFVGKFKGVVDRRKSSNECIYFEGNIQQLLILRDRRGLAQEEVQDRQQKKYVQKDNDQNVLDELEQIETNFKGYFKGSFYYWQSHEDIHHSHISKKKIVEVEYMLSRVAERSINCNKQLLHGFEKKEIEEKDKHQVWEYFLPTVARFQIEQINSINLEKSSAVISGILHLEIHYNDTIKKLMDNTQNLLRIDRQIRKANKMSKQNPGKTEGLEFQNLLEIQIGLQRDVNISLNFQDEEDQSDDQSQNSEWSVLNKTWDTIYQDDKQRKIFKFRIWKCFTTQIDNSYGSFWAPFNLTLLKIVLNMHYFTLKDEKKKKVKAHLIATDVLDYDPDQGGYDPFKPFEDLEKHKNNYFRTYQPHANRIHKINRFRCPDTNTYMIADNRLALYPHYRNILINKNTANDKFQWTGGMYNKLPLLKEPDVFSVAQGYEYFYHLLTNYNYEEKNQIPKVQTFQFVKWNYVNIEVPIYKYVAIDMLNVFVPLILISLFSLFIFGIENGVAIGLTDYTILNWRIANIIAILFAYVSLIPIIQSSLPPMPGFTLVELITYILTIPNLLALINGMLDYTIPMQTWIDTYRPFRDGLFVGSLTLTVICIIFIIILFAVYKAKDYKTSKRLNLPQPHQRKIQYRAPVYMKFMKKIMKKRPQIKLLPA